MHLLRRPPWVGFYRVVTPRLFLPLSGQSYTGLRQGNPNRVEPNDVLAGGTSVANQGIGSFFIALELEAVGSGRISTTLKPHFEEVAIEPVWCSPSILELITAGTFGRDEERRAHRRHLVD